MATIRERKNKDGSLSFQVQWRLGGSRTGRYQTCTFPTRDLAEAADRIVDARGKRITNVEVEKIIYVLDDDKDQTIAPTLGEFATAWFDQRAKRRDIQSHILDEYRRVYGLRVHTQLGGLPITAITADTRDDWLGWLKQQPSRRGGTLKPRTIVRAHSLLHSLLGAAVPRWLPSNPIARPTGSRGRVAGLPDVIPFDAVFLEPREIDLILKSCDPLIRDMVDVSVRTGLRYGELIVLRPQDVLLTGKKKLIKVRRAVKADGSVGLPKSPKSTRDVTVSDRIAEILSKRCVGKGKDDLIFTTILGHRWASQNLRYRYWYPALGAAQRCAEHPPTIPAKDEGKRGPQRTIFHPGEISICDCPTRLHRVPRWHDLRHTHVGLCVEAGWDPVRIQYRLGHESLSTTMGIYGRLWKTDDADRLNDIEQLLSIDDEEDED